MDEMAFGRCGTGFEGAEATSSGSSVALRLRFLGDGAPGCTFNGVSEFPGCEVTG